MNFTAMSTAVHIVPNTEKHSFMHGIAAWTTTPISFCSKICVFLLISSYNLLRSQLTKQKVLV